MVREYIEEVSKEEPNLLRGLDDFDRWKRASDMRNPNKSQSSFLRKNLVRNFEERSNGESALAFFVDSIKDNTLYLLDEPTTGLHFDDVAKLMKILLELRDQGNTVIVIEHNLDVLKSVDYIFDMGPGGGKNGGVIIAEGTPEQLAANPASVTGPFLAEIL